MDVIDAIKKRRSIRHFTSQPVDQNILTELIDLARRAPSAANKQPIEYIIVNQPDFVSKIFEQLSWAAYVQPKRNPPAGHRPTAYIIVLINKAHQLSHFAPVDAAAAITSILLAAVDKGLGTCWLASVQRDNVRNILSIPDGYDIDSVVALGYPDERTNNGRFKRRLDQILSGR